MHDPDIRTTDRSSTAAAGHWTRPSRRRLLASLGGAALGAAALGAVTTEAAAAPRGPVAVPSVPEPVPPARPVIPDRSVSVADFGALPDDGVDDGAAIQAAIDAVAGLGGGTVWFEDGVYDLSVRREAGVMYTPVTLRPRTRLAARTRGRATLRMADDQGDYHTMVGTFASNEIDGKWPGNDPVPDIAVDGLVFDLNGPGTPIHDEGHPFGAQPYQRNALWVIEAERVSIEHCRFTDSQGITVVLVSGNFRNWGSDVTLAHCTFDQVGGTARDYDHSSVNVDATRCVIEHCTLTSRNGAGTTNARTALEPHGDDKRVAHNTVVGYNHGVNLTGTRQAQSVRQLVEHNEFRDVQGGIYLWHRVDRGELPGGLKDTVIRCNDMVLDASSWFGLYFNHWVSGVYTHPSTDAPIETCVIAQNRITYRNLEPIAHDRDFFLDGVSAGIALWQFGEKEFDMRDIWIVGNVIAHPLSAGIWSNVNLTGGAIARNVVVDPGTNGYFDPPKDSYWPGYVHYRDEFRVPVFVTGQVTDVTIRHNRLGG